MGRSALQWPVSFYVYVCTWACVTVDDRDQPWMSPSSALPSTSIETGSSVGLDLKNEAQLASQQALGPSNLCPSDHKCAAPCLSFIEC